MTFILSDKHEQYHDMNIVMYGSFIHTIYRKNDIQRHKVFSKLGLRTVLSPQFWKQKESMLHSIVLRGYALDNGAYINFKKQTPFNNELFIKLCKDLGQSAYWIAIPDVVANKKQTLKQANHWIQKLKKINPKTTLLFVWQDGMTKQDILPYIKDGIGIFIGGTTEAKIQAIPFVSDLCNEHNSWCHVGRVNSIKRLKICLRNNVKSIDGSGFTQFLTHNQQFKNFFDFKKKQIPLFNIPNKKDFSKLTTFKNRIHQHNIKINTYNNMLNINTDFFGLGKNNNKHDYPILKWRQNEM